MPTSLKIGRKKKTYKNFSAANRAVVRKTGLTGKRAKAYTATILRKKGDLPKRKKKR